MVPELLFLVDASYLDALPRRVCFHYVAVACASQKRQHFHIARRRAGRHSGRQCCQDVWVLATGLTPTSRAQQEKGRNADQRPHHSTPLVLLEARLPVAAPPEQGQLQHIEDVVPLPETPLGPIALQCRKSSTALYAVPTPEPTLSITL
jgi:hypothetical protein